MCNLLPYSRQSLCSYAPWQSCLPNAVVGKWNIDTKDPELLLLMMFRHVWWQIQYQQKWKVIKQNNYTCRKRNINEGSLVINNKSNINGGPIRGREGEEAENEGILVKDWFVTKLGPKKIRAEIIFWVGRFETDISNVDTHLSVPVSAVVFFFDNRIAFVHKSLWNNISTGGESRGIWNQSWHFWLFSSFHWLFKDHYKH